TVILADHLRHERARLDADRLVDDAFLLRVVPHLHVADHREILAERMTDETVVRQDTAEVRMAPEQNPVKIERLALVPVSGAPDTRDRVEQRLAVVRAERAKAEPKIVRDRHQLIDDREAAFRPVERRIAIVLLERDHVVAAKDAATEAGPRRALRLPFVAAVDEVVDAREVHQHLEAEGRVVPQSAAHVEQRGGVDLVRELTGVQRGREALDSSGEARVDRIGKRGESWRKLFSAHVVSSQCSVRAAEPAERSPAPRPVDAVSGRWCGYAESCFAAG